MGQEIKKDIGSDDFGILPGVPVPSGDIFDHEKTAARNLEKEQELKALRTSVRALLLPVTTRLKLSADLINNPILPSTLADNETDSLTSKNPRVRRKYPLGTEMLASWSRERHFVKEDRFMNKYENTTYGFLLDYDAPKNAPIKLKEFKMQVRYSQGPESEIGKLTVGFSDQEELDKVEFEWESKRSGYPSGLVPFKPRNSKEPDLTNFIYMYSPCFVTVDFEHAKKSRGKLTINIRDIPAFSIDKTFDIKSGKIRFVSDFEYVQGKTKSEYKRVFKKNQRNLHLKYNNSEYPLTENMPTTHALTILKEVLRLIPTDRDLAEPSALDTWSI